MLRYVRYCWLLFVLVSAVILFGCEQKNEGQKPPGDQGAPHAAPKLTIQPDEEPLLLLDEPPTQELPPPEGPVADNSRCHVCHMNYEDEELAVLHARANIGCEQCHGACDAHCSDEDNVTPPDTMYPLEKINSSCTTCHPKENIDTEQHQPLFDGMATENKYCTDCHGNHRLGYRTRRWDKTTGELIEDDKVRMTTESMPE
ncbi:MAG: hypothetical protein ACYST6_20855 [Planctomycetota bacterium]